MARIEKIFKKIPSALTLVCLINFSKPPGLDHRSAVDSDDFVAFERPGQPSIDTIDTETLRYVQSIRSIGYSKKFENFKTPLLKELSRSSRDSFESDSDSK